MGSYIGEIFKYHPNTPFQKLRRKCQKRQKTDSSNYRIEILARWCPLIGASSVTRKILRFHGNGSSRNKITRIILPKI